MLVAADGLAVDGVRRTAGLLKAEPGSWVLTAYVRAVFEPAQSHRARELVSIVLTGREEGRVPQSFRRPMGGSPEEVVVSFNAGASGGLEMISSVAALVCLLAVRFAPCLDHEPVKVLGDDVDYVEMFDGKSRSPFFPSRFESRKKHGNLECGP